MNHARSAAKGAVHRTLRCGSLVKSRKIMDLNNDLLFLFLRALENGLVQDGGEHLRKNGNDVDLHS